MTINFYRNKSVKNTIGKDIIEIFTLNDLSVNQDIDITNPTLLIQVPSQYISYLTLNNEGINYCYISDLKRYYFINRFTFKSDSLVELSLHVDVLESCKNILYSNLTTYEIIRSNDKTYYNNKIFDNKLTILNNRNVTYKALNPSVEIFDFEQSNSQGKEYRLVLVYSENPKGTI